MSVPVAMSVSTLWFHMFTVYVTAAGAQQHEYTLDSFVTPEKGNHTFKDGHSREC